MKLLKNILWVTVMSVFLTSCVSYQPPPTPPPVIPPLPPVIGGIPNVPRFDIKHTIAPGETLWRISKMYDVPMANILSANRIRKEDPLKMGASLKVPRARKAQQPISLFPSQKWRYIIIHHTATEAGSSLSFHNSHLARGWENGVGYHFVINNGHGDKADGFVEVTPRWLKQQDGAHCKADDMNLKAIGISLVGDFTNHSTTDAQMQSLVAVVQTLSDYYNIPKSRILKHGEVNGSSTECPGKNFPWSTLKNRL